MCIWTHKRACQHKFIAFQQNDTYTHTHKRMSYIHYGWFVEFSKYKNEQSRSQYLPFFTCFFHINEFLSKSVLEAVSFLSLLFLLLLVYIWEVVYASVCMCTCVPDDIEWNWKSFPTKLTIIIWKSFFSFFPLLSSS